MKLKTLGIWTLIVFGVAILFFAVAISTTSLACGVLSGVFGVISFFLFIIYITCIIDREKNLQDNPSPPTKEATVKKSWSRNAERIEKQLSHPLHNTLFYNFYASIKELSPLPIWEVDFTAFAYFKLRFYFMLSLMSDQGIDVSDEHFKEYLTMFDMLSLFNVKTIFEDEQSLDDLLEDRNSAYEKLFYNSTLSDDVALQRVTGYLIDFVQSCKDGIYRYKINHPYRKLYDYDLTEDEMNSLISLDNTVNSFSNDRISEIFSIIVNKMYES